MLTVTLRWSLVLLVAGAACAASLTLAQLEALPMAKRQTADYHHYLARAHQAAAHPGAAAEALATATLLPPGQRVDQTALRAWLEEQSRTAITEARAAMQRGDTSAAVKGYLTALKCDPARGAKEDPLKDEAAKLLTQRVQSRPDLVELRFQRATFLYATRDIAGAEQEFRAHAAAEKDPYRSWRSTAWASRMKDELDARRAMAAPAAPSAPEPPPDTESRSSGSSRRSSNSHLTDPRVNELDTQISRLNARISGLENPGRRAVIKEAGRSKVVSGNDSRVTAELEKLKSERDTLVRERDYLSPRSAPQTSSSSGGSTDRATEVDDRLRKIAREEKELSGTGYAWYKEDGEWKKVSKLDPRAQTRRDALAAEKAQLENERAVRGNAPPPPPEPRAEADPALDAPAAPPADDPNEEEKRKLDQQLRDLDYEITSLTEEGGGKKSVVDEQGTRRYLKPSDSRYQTYLAELQEKRRKMQIDRDIMR